MSEVFPRDILFRAGARTLARYGVPVLRRGIPSRGGEEGKEAFARAGAGYFFDRGHVLRVAAANVPRLDYGLTGTDPVMLSEGARTNVALRCRDLANGAYSATNVTPVKDQVGLDGVASAASRITATAADGFIVQPVTLASSLRCQTAYVRRLVGTSPVYMSTDGFSTRTPVTVTSDYTRVSIPQQTLANPSFGFQFTDSADSIVVDFVQNENGGWPTSPILTTTVAVTRPAEAFVLPVGYGPQDITVFWELARPAHADLAGTLAEAPGIFQVGNGSSPPSLSVVFLDTARQYRGKIDTSVTDGEKVATFPAGATLKGVAQFKNLTTAGLVALDVNDGGGLSSFSSAATAFDAWGLLSLYLGGNSAVSMSGGYYDIIGVMGLRSLAEMDAIP